MYKWNKIPKQRRGKPQEPEQVGPVFKESHVKVFLRPRAAVVEVFNNALFGQSQVGNVIFSVKKRLPS